MLEAEQPEERNREESGCEAKEELSLNSARRGCGRWRRGGLGSLRGPGRRGAGAGGGGQRISKPLRGLVFKSQVSEEFCCQIVVVLSLFCLILDLIQHHFHLLWCGLKFYQL